MIDCFYPSRGSLKNSDLHNSDQNSCFIWEDHAKWSGLKSFGSDASYWGRWGDGVQDLTFSLFASPPPLHYIEGEQGEKLIKEKAVQLTIILWLASIVPVTRNTMGKTTKKKKRENRETQTATCSPISNLSKRHPVAVSYFPTIHRKCHTLFDRV